MLPPLLAPQGWCGGIAPAVGARYQTFEIHSRGIGGCFVKPDFDLYWVMTFTETPRLSYTLAYALPPLVEQPGIRTTVSAGNDTLPIPNATNPLFLGTQTNVAFQSEEVYVPSGVYMYCQCVTIATALNGAIHIRDVPVGLAPD